MDVNNLFSVKVCSHPSPDISKQTPANKTQGKTVLITGGTFTPPPSSNSIFIEQHH